MKILTLLLLLTSLSGCETLTGYSHDYPNSWPAVSNNKSTECPDISGTYINAGLPKYDRGEYNTLSESLGYRLLGYKSYGEGNENKQWDEILKITKVKEVHITQTSKELNVRVDLDSGPIIKSWKITDGEVTCADGWVWIPQGSVSDGSGVGGYHSSLVLGVNKTSSGSIVGREHNSTIGAVMWVVPIGGTQILWYHWDKN